MVLLSLFLHWACNGISVHDPRGPDSSLCRVIENLPDALTMHQIDSIIQYDDKIDSICLYIAIQYLIENGNYRSALNLSYKLPSKDWITWARRIDAFQGMNNIDSSLFYGRLWLSHCRNTNSADSVSALNAIGQVYDNFQWFDSALVYYQTVASLYSRNSPHEVEPENTHLKVFMCFLRIGRKEEGIEYLKTNSPQLISRYELYKW